LPPVEKVKADMQGSFEVFSFYMIRRVNIKF
jgi:hypothetical protein